MPDIIKPTIGRRVWFRPSDDFLARNPSFTQLKPGQPMDAGIVYVHHDHLVNLAVCDHVGHTHAVPLVPLIAGQWEPSDSAEFSACEWMPYQKAQHAKATTTPEPDFLAGVKACDLSGEGTCEACQ